MKLIHELQQMYENRIKIVKYEELYSAPLETIKMLFEFVQLPFEKETEQFLYDSTHKTVDDPYSVFRNHSEKQMKKELPENIIQKIKDDVKQFKEAEQFNWF